MTNAAEIGIDLLVAAIIRVGLIEKVAQMARDGKADDEIADALRAMRDEATQDVG